MAAATVLAMQFLEGGASGPNGRESRTVRSSDQDPADADPVAEHGSLMFRYRGAPQPPAAEDEPTSPRTGDKPSGPLPAPGARSPARASEDNPWRRSSWTPAPLASPPAPPAAPTPPATSQPPTSRPPSTPAPATPPPVTPDAPATPPPDAPASAAPAPEKPAEAAAEKPVDEPAGIFSVAAPVAEKPADRAADTASPGPAATSADTSTPASTPGTNGLLSAAESAGFRRRWRELQGEFVDDPQRAVRGAGDLSREILQALADTIADAERIDRWKAEDGTSGTEDLRVALRQYRTLVDRLLEL